MRDQALVRPRSAADLPECERIAEEVHALDGYPPYLPTDLGRFLAGPDTLAAWVAEDVKGIAGHVALHSRSSDAVMRTASTALRAPIDRLGVVARLIVAPDARRRGVGRSLLAVATNDALARGLTPILDVATRFQPAIDLYESAGWRRAGRVTVRFSDGSHLDEYVYVYVVPTGDAGA